MKVFLLVFILFIIVFLPTYIGITEAQREFPILVIHKIVSPDNFDWSEEITVNLIVSNQGEKIVNDVIITDLIPAGFSSSNSNDDKIIVDVNTINPGEEFTHSYTIKAIEELTSTSKVSIHFPRAIVSYSGSQEFNIQSNKISATVNPSQEWSETHTVEAVGILLLVTFAFGAFGATINWLNADNETKEARKMMEDPTKIWHHSLLGGAAGVIVLATFEGLSMLFSDGQLKLNPQNIVVLVGTCFAAGFAPLAVIERATKQWKTSSAQLENETETLQRKLEDREKESGIQISELKKQLDDESDKKKDFQQAYEIMRDNLENVQQKLKEFGGK